MIGATIAHARSIITAINQPGIANDFVIFCKIAKEIKLGLNVLGSAADAVDFLLAGLSTVTGKIKANRAQVVAVLTAMLGGLQFVHNQRSDAIALVQKIFRIERSLAEAGYDQTLKAYSKDGTASVKGIESVLEVARQ